MLLTNFLTIHLLLNLLLTSLFYFYSVFSSAFLYVFGGRAHNHQLSFPKTFFNILKAADFFASFFDDDTEEKLSLCSLILQ